MASIKDKDELKQLCQDMYPTRGMEFLRYGCDVESYSINPPGYGWDIAQALDAEKPKNIAEFILDGRFIECCQSHAELDDKTMCSINKDVHNRIYTLVLMKVFG